jgi:hypothetical protein
MGEMRSAYKCWSENLMIRDKCGRSWCRLEDNIRMDVREIGWKGVDWIHLAPDSDQWWALVSTVTVSWVP